jgi:uncharacterized membrane protein
MDSVIALFFLPGDVILERFGAAYAPAIVSAAVWILAICAIVYFIGFFQDAVDPTYRQQKRERKRAERLRRR